MKLYLFPPSTRVLGIVALKNHLALDREVQPIDLGRGDQLTPQHLALNPKKSQRSRSTASCFGSPTQFCFTWQPEELCGTAPDVIDLRVGALGELLRKQEKLVAPAAAAPPRQADLSRRTIRLQRSGNERGSHQHAGIDREFRQKRGAESVVDHLYQRLQTGCFERVTVPAIGVTAGGERVLAQAMPVLEQQQILGQMLRVDIALLDQRMLGWQCCQQRIVEQDDRLGRAAVVGQRQQDEVELALVQQIDQARRQVLG